MHIGAFVERYFLTLEIDDAADTLAPEQFEAAHMHAAEQYNRCPGIDGLDMIDGSGHAEIRLAASHRRGYGVGRRLHIADIGEAIGTQQLLGDVLRSLADRRDSGKSHSRRFEGTLLGDGLIAVFTSARQAIDCALKCNAAAEGAGLQLHLGLHAGDVLREGNNVYGGAVNIAARISGLSTPGDVLVSDTVRSLARTSAGVRFDDRGERALKGVGDAVRVWAVREAE